MPEDTQRPLRIFLAEDNRADVYLVEIALREHKLHFVLQSVSDGEEAIRAVERFGQGEAVPDIALLDLNLPRQEGDKILSTIRQQPCCLSMPVVLMTSSESQRDRATAEQYQATFFSKPPELAGFLALGPLVRSLCYPDVLAGSVSEEDSKKEDIS
ncbi:MAG: response regulator [Acidobacteriaceae bacterium]|nr:response regulator [Acidobacteriaceae bacterium]MBV9497762.1 response regulator [Acidobacteriaceae bacterium]